METSQLFVATVFLRPYVFVLLAFSLTAAPVAIGWHWIGLFTGITWMDFKRCRQWGPVPGFVGRGVLS